MQSASSVPHAGVFRDRTSPPVAVPSRRHRVAAAVAVGVVAAAVTAAKTYQNGHTSDFAVFWLAARALVEGANPYAAVYPGVRGYIDSGFLYPLPAALVVAPLALLRESVAAAVFSGTGMGLLAYALTRESWARLPILLSLPALLTLTAVQWVPFVMAAALTPGMAWAAACKPNLGFAMFLARPSWRWLAVGAGIVAVSLLVRPGWPWEWLASLRTVVPGSKVLPLLVPGGVFLLLAGLRWRRPEGRLLFGLACVPQTVLFCDQLALGLVAETRKEALVMGLWSYAVPLGAYVAMRNAMPTSDAASFALLARLITWGYYLPALAVVLWRPNVGRVPPRVDRYAARLPVWLRGAQSA